MSLSDEVKKIEETAKKLYGRICRDIYWICENRATIDLTRSYDAAHPHIIINQGPKQNEREEVGYILPTENIAILNAEMTDDISHLRRMLIEFGYKVKDYDCTPTVMWKHAKKNHSEFFDKYFFNNRIEELEEAVK